MDRIDKSLLTLLQRDASKTNFETAEEVALSPCSACG
ncbi:DNA-binding Lrp family transcriptional regulator [Rhizobium leguminosarum]|uniref:AsnC-type helix-turn-helix domain family protein n=1 Tax=Rhizobium leguminosarum TaxID=384 RepID=A0A2Z4YQH8_RHILE|nr:AsnC-type helix-turn-helix domain family protein [Rhizobium leguminosarum]MBA9036831.1 DNA-binding Lrp family transcriptional regulator [Rhizobium leguminosarum]